MKVLYVIPSYEPAWAFGGTVTATSQLCRALAKQGIDITVYTTDADGKGKHLDVPLSKPVNLGGVKTWYFNCDFGIKRAFYSRGLTNQLKKTIKDFDLVHVSAIWQWIQVDVYKACKYFSKPYIVSTYGSFSPWPWNHNFIRKRLYWHIFVKKTIKSAKSIHYTAEEERLKSYFTVPELNKIPSFIVPHGVDIKKIQRKDNIRESLSIRNNKFVILFIGRINRIKGIHLIFEAMKKLDDKRFLILVVGPKEDICYYNNLIKLSREIQNSVIWHEQVSQSKIWDFYYSSNLLVLPSYHENFGMVIIEAMACGLPVLISEHVGIWREIKADGAGFVIKHDVDEMVDVLKKISDNEEILKQIGQNARKSVENRYDIDKVASLMIKAYEDVLSGRRSSELQWK